MVRPYSFLLLYLTDRVFVEDKTSKTGGFLGSVHLCSASAKYNTVLSFHTFPSDRERRKRWIINIRRENRNNLRLKGKNVTESGSGTTGRRPKKPAIPVLLEMRTTTRFSLENWGYEVRDP